MIRWTNWAGNVSCDVHSIEHPGDEPALTTLLTDARRDGRSVRVAGSGHSFSELVATDGTVVSLDGQTGIVRHDAYLQQVTVRAGTRLHDLGKPLHELGFAQENLGDIDVQALGGAIATGTHGTGRALGNLSSRVVGVRLMLASGDVLELDAECDADRLRAARVSLGALGIATEITLEVLPAYRLRERTWRSRLAPVLEALDSHIAGHRHFEFFYFPKHDFTECKSLDLAETSNDGPADVGLPGGSERTGWSFEMLPSVREERFVEMEYAVPAEVGPTCFETVRERIRSQHPNVVWPIEYRTIAADDALLSPAHGRETVTISVHQDGRFPHEPLFRDVEPIFVEHGGRPHWGKAHYRDAAGLASVYPAWETFGRIRDELDPEGRFLSDSLRRVLGA